MAELGVQKVRIYPVTRIQGRADIELLFTPHQKISEARFRCLEFRGMERLMVSEPALRAPQVISRLCGSCGPFHQIAACLALENACGCEVPTTAARYRELLAWLWLLSSHLTDIIFNKLPDYALPKSDASVRNVTGIYKVEQEAVGRLASVLSTISGMLDSLAGLPVHPAAVVPGGVSALPDKATLDKASGMLRGCEDDLHETLRLVQMLVKRESMMLEPGPAMEGYYVSVSAGGRPTLIGDEVLASPFTGNSRSSMDPPAFVGKLRQSPLEWTYLVPVTVDGLEPVLVGPLARASLSFGRDTPWAELECARAAEKRAADAGRRFHSFLAVALEVIWGWEKARRMLDEGFDGGKTASKMDGLSSCSGLSVVESPHGTIAHSVKIDQKDRVEEYRVVSPLQLNHELLNVYLSGVARGSVTGIEITDKVAQSLQLAVRAFNPCVQCGTH